jgi:hypothetical protein
VLRKVKVENTVVPGGSVLCLNLELGTWNLELGTWNLELGTWNLELGTWNLELGTIKYRNCYFFSVHNVPA